MSETAEQITLLEESLEVAKQGISALSQEVIRLQDIIEKENIGYIKYEPTTKGGAKTIFPPKFLPEAEQVEGTILKVNKEYGIRLHIAPFLGNNWIMYKVYHNGKEKMLMAKYNKEGEKFYNIKGKRFYWKDMDKINWDYTYTKSSNNSTNTLIEKTSVSSEDMSLLHTILKCSETLYTKFNTL
jgi:hypothetical protein